jgi:integrase
MATITKRGDRQWQAKVRRRGFSAVTNTFETKARAERWARLVESEIDEGSFVPRGEAESTTLGQALNRYLQEITPQKKGAKQEANRIRQWLEHPLSKRFLTNIRGNDIAAYRDERLAAGKSPITVNNELIIISHLFNTARKEWGMEILRNPVSNIRKPKQPSGRDRRLLLGEEQQLLEMARYPMDTLIVLALETGMRQGELLSLRMEDIDLVRRTATLSDTKNGSERIVPLSSKAVKAIQGMPKDITGRLFPAMSASNASHMFSSVCKSANIEGLRFHDLRHEATSRFFERGLDMMEVATITGHKTLHMLKRYTHLRAEDLAKKLG